jgi:phospholipase C
VPVAVDLADEAAMRVFVAASGISSVLLLACGQAGSASRSAGPSVVVGVDGPGRILSLRPAIDCPGICSASFASGTSVTLLATSADEVTFAGWSGECSGAVGCSFTLARDAAVLARFEMLHPDQKK